ncbi:MAG: BolA family transcriptional regulator [Rhodospirillales bacterium]|nr:BolA family transcriptional regulator [Rhodospirillales bacterium]
MTVAEIMRAKLTQALSPDRLVITDDSHRHVDHAGHRPDGESHFHVEIVAAAFSGKSRLQRQRMVYEVLADELAGRVHALALTTLTPEQDRDARGG